MAILHGIWLINPFDPQDSSLFIWAENWRKINEDEQGNTDEIKVYPYSLNIDELLHLSEIAKRLDLTKENLAVLTSTKTISLPVVFQPDTEKLLPIHSSTNIDQLSLPSSDQSLPISKENIGLYPWQIAGISLPINMAINFLESLPLGNINDDLSFIGSDLKFWSHINRWGLDLLARCKFLPVLSAGKDNNFLCQWATLLDSGIDQNRLQRFAEKMPFACRTYQLENQPANSDYINNIILTSPRLILENFLSLMLEYQIRNTEISIEKNKIMGLNPIIRQWLRAISSKANLLIPVNKENEILANIIKQWQTPLQQTAHNQNQFVTCFRLVPPSVADHTWLLEYGLQAKDDPNMVVTAPTIWSNPVAQFSYQGRQVKFPQETLLSGLGLASRIFPPIETSLQDACPQACPLNSQQVYELIKNAAWRLMDSGLGVILPSSLNRSSSASRLGLSLEAGMQEKTEQRLTLKSLLDFQWQLTIGEHRISRKEFEKLVKLNTPLVEVNGEWVELQPQEVKAVQTFLTSRQANLSLSLEDALRLAQGDTQTIEKLPILDFQVSGELQTLLDSLTNNQTIDNIAVPQAFQGKLRPYQIRGISWLAFLEKWGLGACLADDMGMGKTPQLIAFLLHLQENNFLPAPVLLICPTSVLGNWEREVKKFAPSLKTILHYGDKRPKGKDFVKAIKGKNLILTSYNLIHRDIATLRGIKWQGLVLDEAQNIKNPEAKQSQAVREIEADFKIALTGTPLENRLLELWSILDFLNPDYLGKKQFFQRRFAIPIEKYGDTNSLKVLRSLVQPFILRRLKTDREIIQDLPIKQENTVFCPLAKEQAQLYKQIVDQSLNTIDEATGIQRRGMILALLVKLKQLCNHPVLLTKSENAGTLLEHHSGKLQRLVEMLEEVLAEGERALIFTQFAEWGKLLQPYLEEKLNRQILYLYGGSKKNQREEMIDRFQLDPQGPPIMILSLKAGGTGLNLTRASHVFHYDRWWNPAVENQATDRAFRIGQTKNVQVHKFVCIGTLEEKIHDLIESKKELAEQVVTAGENWLTEMDTDQLRNLLVLERDAIIEDE